jgi:hypothetical protein
MFRERPPARFVRAMRRYSARLFLVAACAALTVTSAPPAEAQTKTTTTPQLLERASDLFYDQQYEESIQTLSAALLRPGTPIEQRVDIYRLLAYNYITLKRTEEADGAVRGLLVLKEDFKLPESESPRFRDFFRQVRDKWLEEGKPGKTAEGKPAEAEKPIGMKHASPAQVEPGTAVKLTCSLDDPSKRVGGVKLNYRTGSKGKFITTNATGTAKEYSAEIPASVVKPPLVEYYLEAVDENGLPLASRGDAAAPLRVVVPGGEDDFLTSPWFWVPVGAAVVGGAILTAVLISSSDDGAATTSRVTITVRE